MARKNRGQQWTSKRNRESESYLAVFLIFVFAVLINSTSDVNFDYLIFSQRWLPSSCIEYMEKNASTRNHHCILPDNYDMWAVHGLWPTKDHKFGPFFCNQSMKFDVKSLEPIITDLKGKWPNIEGGKSVKSLWKHEWDKHGTCAAEIESLSDELKYFNTTLQFFQQYNVQNVFDEYDIVASNAQGFNVMKIFNTIKSAFGKNPHINCITEVNSQDAYLSEIRLCFDLSLRLIDCEEINNKIVEEKKNLLSKTLTNCPLDSLIKIPDKIIPTPSDSEVRQKSEEGSLYDKLKTILNVINFLQWLF